ncbi:unnamed protein product [Toxocara canis]|uniref:t-SNARE coiled-coil homology domain-containing protein n=1 Tax=Toxocara canis TaxID=6265 RepID=A0A183UX68_TOXCA|nr:unnamed protein product [Toxocara canis]
MAAAPLFKAVKFPPARIQTRSRGNLNFTEIRERIVKIAGNVTKYSGKVQNGISKMDIQKNKLSGESSEAIVKEKQLTDERHSLEEQLSTATKEVASTSQQLQQTNKQIEKEAQDVRNAQNDLNHKRREKPRWHCIWRCRKKWKKAQRGRIRAAEVVLQAAQQRHANAIKRKAEQEAKLNSLNQRVSSVRTSLARNQQESNRWKERLLNSTHLTEMVLQLLKDLTSLQLNVAHLKQELEARQDLDDEDLGVGWESINAPLEVISNYLNNGGFVKDLAGWGIDITGSLNSSSVCRTSL